ncbi:Mannan endo-1,6-alpha-mannosidase DFG5 [Trichoderma lentiforme]|uniref:Mannan endo-1,6-alpha-mannosidase DFG5 n=1 Tax=Trichoderma lentiforme TaxID=1567552 RepID=A0A9P4X2K1_9HYPO|nr:Mannan endo-1,6-alpha-mannosidase DFG5 [Trichoderma lentiforme]
MASKTLLALTALVAAGAYADNTSYDVNAGCSNDQLLRWYDEDIGLFLYPNGAYYFWQAGVMITAVASLAALDSGVKSRTAAMWQNTYLKGGQPSHGVIQLDSTGRKIVVPKGSASRIPSKFRKREQGFLASHYDDEGWWGLAWQDVYDLTGVQDYLTESIAIWQDMNAGWGNLNCGGLPWFKGEAKTDNPLAIPNELYLAISASLANRVPSSQKQTYLSAAQTAWAWFQKVGFINSQGLVNDAVNGNTCVNDNNQPTWTYNQGVIIGGLADLYIATGDSSYLTSASGIANATMAHLVDSNGILADSCDLSHSCSGDNLQFKGVFARNLQKLYHSQPFPAYKAFLEKNAQSIWQNDLAVEAGDCFNGADWGGPYVIGSATASSQSSALQCLVAALYVSQN